MTNGMTNSTSRDASGCMDGNTCDVGWFIQVFWSFMLY